MRMGTSSHRLRGRNNTLCIILAVLIIGTSAQTCDQPLGLQDKRIKSAQITVSSTATNSDKEYVRFGCCDGMTIGGWCPASAAQGEWVQVNFDTPTLITAIQISHPATVDNTRYPTDYLKTYSIKYAVPGSNGTLTDLLEGNQPAIVEGTFNRSLAYKTNIGYLTVDSIRIQVESFEQQPCFRMELFGCDPYDICPLGCENGGYCNGPNRCQCPFGFYGDRCEHSSLNCNTPLGMGDGSIRLNQITASSTAADSRLEYARYGCCDNAGTPVGGWCPATNAKTEYLQVALDKPMRISAIGSRHPGRNDQSTYQTTYLKSYRVRYHVPQTAMWKYYGDYRGAAVFPAAYNDSLSYTIGITPFVTDRIQLYVEDFKNRPCSQFEFFGCDPTNLCSVPCKNGGSCKGPNQCSCPKGFGGAQCQLTPSTVVTQKCVFQNIIGTTLVSTSFNLTVIGNPVLLGNTLQLNGQNQAIQMPRKSRECLGNLNRCTTGLTIGLNVKFQTLTPNAVIISSADLTNPASNGITLLTVSNGLSLNVRTSSLDCTANSQPNILTVNQEVKLEVSFDQQTGVQLYMNNRVVAETKASECQTRRNLNPVSQPITIGGPVTPSGAYATIEVRGLTYWYVSRPNLVNIGLINDTDTPESTTIPTERPVTTTTTKPTTVNPLKTISVDFKTLVTDKILVTTDFNAELTGTPLVDNTTDKGPAIKLTTDTVCINMGRPPTCLGDVERCTEGLTISFQIKCEQLAENTYILSSGGELPDSYGVAVVYRFGRMQFMLTTSDSSWFGSAPLSTQCQWSRYDLTWKNDTGLAVYQNEILVAEQKQPTPRGQGSYVREPIFIGCSSDPKNTTKPKSVWMKNLNFWLTTRTILVRKGIIVTTIPPSTSSTTTKPTTTTPWLKTSPGTCPAGCQPIGTTGFPTLPKSPTLDATDSKAPKMLFYCNIPRTSEANVNYFVEWYVNGKVVKNEWVQSTVDRAVLDPVADKQFCFGQGVYCSVRARYTGVCSGPISPPLYSNRFVPSIKLVTQGTIKLREGGEEKNIVLQTNAPPYLLCDRTASIPGDKMCSVSIETGLMQSTRDLRCGDRKTHISQAVFRWLGGNSAAAAYCGLDVSGTKWSENIVIPVKAKADGRYDYKQERLVTVALKTVCGQKIAQKVLTTETKLKVEVTDGDRRAACSSTNDPHMSTFDRRRYNNFYEGEFVLYRHKELPYAVHAFYKKCHRATCNCGVGVKSGDDVIMIDRCQGLKTKRTKKSKKSKRSKYSRGTTYPVQVNIYKNGELTPGTRIFSTNRGQSYEIHMPHGTYVTVQIHGSMYINIVVTPSASDFQRVEGLCGNYDGSSRNDLVKRDGKLLNTRSIYPNDFSKSWRVLAGESIFTGVAATRAKGQNNGAIYCDCILGKAPRCGYSFDIETCDVRTRGTEVTRTFLRNAKPARPARYRGKRQAVENGPQIDYPTPPTFDLTFNPEPPSWPAAGMTEREATEFCKAEIADNAFAAKCNLLTEKNSTEDVEDCVSDILATNSTDYVAQQQEAIKGQCMTELQRDSALSGDNPNPGNLSINVTELTENLCPGNCSGNGTCVEGQCQCNSGLGGADCSTDLDAPPLVAGIPDDGLCDVRTGTCNSSEIYGESFIDSDTLKCMIQEVQVTETDTNVVGEIEIVEATFLNTYMVNCQLPKIASYHIQISNDGLNPSVDKVLFLPYNGICHTCDVVTNDTTAATCKRNDLSCIIDGECYAPDDINPDDECMLCRPESPDFWSVDLACRKRKAAGNSAEGGLTKVDIGVIAAAAGFIVAVMIIGFTYLWCRKNAQMKQKKSAYEQSIHRSEKPSEVYENESYDYITPEGGSHTGRYDFVPDGPGEEYVANERL